MEVADRIVVMNQAPGQCARLYGRRRGPGPAAAPERPHTGGARAFEAIKKWNGHLPLVMGHEGLALDVKSLLKAEKRQSKEERRR
jgi:hypothetical protein